MRFNTGGSRWSITLLVGTLLGEGGNYTVYKNS